MSLAARSIVLVAMFAASTAAAASNRPNFVVVLADDLGYSDLGCYGGEIDTPNLDALAAAGLKYTQFYNTGRCWPTRAALLTGYYAQQVGRDALPGIRAGARSSRPSWSRLLPDLLEPLGYRSYHSGKWHVDGGQLQGGFDRSYSLDDHDRFFNPRRHTLDEQRLEPVAADSGYYAATAIADHAIACLQQHATEHAEQPFFSYVAFTSPHFPLQAPAEDVAKYRDRYRVGWDVVRAERWRRIGEKLQLPGDLSDLEPDVGPPYHFPDALNELGPGEVNRELAWTELSDEQREFQAAKMAVHAAMVDRMDQEVGKLVQQLRAMDALDDTVILFMSDNGGSAEIMVRGDRHDADAPPGSAGTFLCLGPGWSSAANTPFRRHKTWVHEGGVATPLIVHWPSGLAAQGELRTAVGHVVDVAPTLVGLAGGAWPDQVEETPLPPSPGQSLAPSFAADVEIPRDSLWWLHEGNRALRQGDWKIVAAKDDPWELYDMGRDRAENDNLAGSQSDRVREMERTWRDITRQIKQTVDAGGRVAR